MTVVISGGKALPIGDRKAWPLAGLEQPRTISSAKRLDLIGVDLAADYAAIYASQPWIYAIVNKISRNVARLSLEGQREDPATYHRERLPMTHPLPSLVSRPFPGGSRFRLVESIVGSLCVFGHQLTWKYRPRPGQPPSELWPLDWSRVTIHAGETTPIDYYEYRAARGTKILLPDDVIHFTWWSPMGMIGTSPLEPLRSTLMLEDAGRRYAISSFANGVRPSGALVSEKKISDPAKKELREQIYGDHGGPDQAFRMLLLDGGLDWKAFSHTAQEAQTIEHRKLNQIEACAVYDMPPPMVQILDRATFSNIDEQHRMLYQDTLGTYVSNVEDTFRAQLLWGEPQLATAVDDADGELENTALVFNMDDVLRADIVKRAAAYAAMRAAGGLTVNDIRLAEGKPKIEHPAADAVLIPLNMEAIGTGELGLAPRAGTPTASSLDTLAEELAARVGGKVDGLVLDLQGMRDALADMGQRDLAGSVAALAESIGKTEPVRIELQPEHHHHDVELVKHEHHDVAPGMVEREVRAALAQLEPPSPETGKRFEYDTQGLVARVVTTRADGTEMIYNVERNADGALAALKEET